MKIFQVNISKSFLYNERYFIVVQGKYITDKTDGQSNPILFVEPDLVEFDGAVLVLEKVELAGLAGQLVPLRLDVRRQTPVQPLKYEYV